MTPADELLELLARPALADVPGQVALFDLPALPSANQLALDLEGPDHQEMPR